MRFYKKAEQELCRKALKEALEKIKAKKNLKAVDKGKSGGRDMNKKPDSSFIIGEIERNCRKHKTSVKILRMDWKGIVCGPMVLLVCENAFPVKGFPKFDCEKKCVYAFGAQVGGQLAIPWKASLNPDGTIPLGVIKKMGFVDYTT